MYICIDKEERKRINFMRKIHIQNIDDNIVEFKVLLPKNEDKYEKIYSKIEKKIRKYNRKVKLIYSKDIKKNNTELIEYMYKAGINSINAKDICKEKIEEIFKYLYNINNTFDLSQIKLGICVNYLDSQVISNIKQLANNVKTMTICLKDRSLIENVIEEIYEDTGMAIQCKSGYKSLKECNFVINYDCNSYKIINNISNKCCVLNLGEEINNIRKDFKGIIINGLIFDVDLIKNVDLNRYNNEEIAYILGKTEIFKLKGIKHSITEDEIKLFNIK